MFFCHLIFAALASSIAIITSFSHGSNSGTGGWTIVDSYVLPEGASGLAWDGANLYCGIYGANGGRVYQINPETGAYSPLFYGEQGDAFGLTYDGEYLWTTDHQGSSSTSAYAMKLNWNGDVIEQFDLPDHYMSGIAYDNGNFWVSRYYPDPGHLYKINQAGGKIDQFEGPDDQPWDLAIENGNIWIADYYGNTLYCIDPKTASVINSHPSEGEDPAGVVWDGQYLWYCDNGDNFNEDILYKVDLQGSGSPEIIIDDQEHAFGNVAIGNSSIWSVSIENTGTANLVINDITFIPDFDLNALVSFPVVIQAGETEILPIEYAPISFGPINAIATVASNDPIHPDESLTITGHGVYPKPTIHIEEATHDFGEVRLGAHTRWFINITNHGEQTLIISKASSDDLTFYIDPEIELPIELDTLASTQIGIWFTPIIPEESESTTIRIYNNDSNTNPALGWATGIGLDIEYPIGTELWRSQFTDDWDNSFKAIAPIPDINNDGIYDLIACSEDNYIRCFNGNADQNGDVLWAHEIYSGNIYSDRGLDVVSDVNGDGHSDIVVGATGGARLIRMLSGKTGEEIWTYHTSAIGNGGWVYQVDGSQDFNNDGLNDVLACAGDDGEGSGPNRAYCLNGFDGQPIWQHPVGGPVYGIIAVEDFTGDGNPDAIAGASNQWETDGLAIGINGGSGQAEWIFEVDGSSVWALAQIGDITFDGVNDVMIGDFYGEHFALDATNGNQQCSGEGLGLLTGFKRIQDINEDGHPEIVPEQFNNFVRIISGKDCSAIWTTPVIDSPTVVSPINDLNSDGISDIIVGTLFSDNYTYFLSGLDGEILFSSNFGTPVDAISAIPDIVGDGSSELIAGGRDGTISCISGGLDAIIYNPADINQDGLVNIQDLLIVMDQWGLTDSVADINNDGFVNVTDLLLVVSNWQQ